MVNQELKGNWRDIFKVVKFSFDPKKVSIQMLSLIIAGCFFLIFTQIACFASGIRFDFLSTILLNSFGSESQCPYEMACSHGFHLGLLGITLLTFGFIFSFMVIFTTNGIISKMAVDSLLKDKYIEMNEALKFGLKNFKSFVLSPVALIVLIGFTFLSLYIGGLIGKITYLGELILSFSVIPIFLGGLLILFLGLVFSFGLVLLPSIIAVEEDDTFGAVCDLFFVVISNFWKLIGYELIFKFVCLVLTITVIGIALLALHLGGSVVMAGVGEVKFFALLTAIGKSSPIFLKITSTIIWIFLAFLGLYLVSIPMVYSNLAHTIIYCNLEEKIKLMREEEKEEEANEEKNSSDKEIMPEEPSPVEK
ncbi:MAG: hypothetical protein ABIG09_01745 [bacterium]